MESLNSSAPFSSLYNPTKYHECRSTNDIYADFDSYMHTRCVAVASFADIFSNELHCNLQRDLPNSTQTPEIQQKNDNGPNFMPMIEVQQQENNVKMLQRQQFNNVPSSMQNSSAPFSSLYKPTKYDECRSTNEIYADFDSYMHTRCAAVASFADIFSDKLHCILPQDLPNSLQTSGTQQPNDNVEMVQDEERSSGPSVMQMQENNVELQQKPRISFTNLNRMAIKSSATGFLRVEDIYAFVCRKYPYYANHEMDTKWKSSIRHSLSSSGFFVSREATFNRYRRQKRYEWGLDPFRANKAVSKKSPRNDKKANKVARKKLQSNGNMNMNALAVPCYLEMEE